MDKSPLNTLSDLRRSPAPRRPIRNTQNSPPHADPFAEDIEMKTVTNMSYEYSRTDVYTDEDEDENDEAVDNPEVTDDDDKNCKTNKQPAIKNRAKHIKDSENSSRHKKNTNFDNDKKSEIDKDNRRIHEKLKRHNKTESGQKGNWHAFKILMLCLVIITVVINFCMGNHVVKQEHNPEEMMQNLDKSIEDIRKIFHEQNSELWNEIIPSIRDVILNSADLSIITLFSNETNTMDCLAKSLGYMSSSVLLGNNRYLEVTPESIGNDLGETIKHFKREVPNTRAVVVKDLLKINAKMLRAFHNLCDKENPLVKKAVLILTMVINIPRKVENREALNLLENQLKHTISGNIEEDAVGPLITRITSGVIMQVRPEQNLRHCVY